MGFDWFKKLFRATPSNSKKQNKSVTSTPNVSMALNKQSTHSSSGNTATHSRKRTDMAAEAELAAFLDLYLYQPLLQEGHFISIKRQQDRNQQLLGIDVEAETKNRKYRIDEKAQLYYINKDLPTFQYLQKKVAYLLDCEGPG